MKKILLTLVAVLAALGASAWDATSTRFYYEDFLKMGNESDVLKDGWLCYGNGAVPEGEIAQNFFGTTGEDPAYMLLLYSDKCAAICNTVFKEGSPAPDQWLVSPEIEVPYDGCVLNFNAIAYAAKGALPYGTGVFKVLMSDGGAEKEDFTTTLAPRIALSSSASSEFSDKNYYVKLDTKKGQKIRLAFVVTSPNVGFMGFTDIALSQYLCEVTNLTKELYLSGDEVDLDFNLRVKCPGTCGALKATVEINGEKVKEETFSKNFATTTTSSLIQRMTFKKVGTVLTGTPLNYKITIQPDFEGAEPTVITGTVSTVEYEYPSNVVVEEVTAVGCGYCPGGTAALEYFLHTYTGSETEGKAIAIAIHGIMNRTDPMNNGVATYVSSAQKYSSAPTLPNVNFNRTTGLQYPYTCLSYFKDAYETKSCNKANLLKVSRPGYDASTEELIGKKLQAEFQVYNGYRSENHPLNASLVIIENDVKGFNSDYDQTNYLYNMSESNFLAQANKEFLPFVKDYLIGGALGQETISYQKMVYQHVARTIYPNYDGEEICKDWQANVPQTFKMEVEFTQNVMKPENTELILIVTDPNNGKIVASDIMPFSEFIVEGSGVDGVAADGGVQVAAEGNVLKVNAAEAGNVDVYSIDGKHLASYAFDGELAVEAEWSGLVVVKVATPGASKAVKLIF